MTDNTQSGSDNDVTRKHPSTEVGTSKIKGTQELDDRQHIKFNILVPFLTAITIKRQKEKGNLTKDTETAYYDFAVDLILDWHNKQIEAVLDRLLEHGEDFTTFGDGGLSVAVEYIEAERNKLKEREDVR